MNLEGRQCGAVDKSGLVRPGRRFSLVTSELDMGPRTALVDRLPRIEGDRADAHMNAVRGCVPGLAELIVGAPVIYDPALPPGGPRSRWMPLVREWRGLLKGDLEVLAAPASEGRLQDLAGLGPGSTPAGDDFLTGFIIGCVWTGRPRPPMPDPSRTTWLSAEILRDAAEGLVWRRGRDVLAALAGDEPGTLLEAAGGMINWGSSSGRAWLAGLAAALDGGSVSQERRMMQ